MEIVQNYSVTSPTIEGGLFAQKGVYVVIKADKNKEEFSDELRCLSPFELQALPEQS